MLGRVKVFFEQKSYGFINGDDGVDYFFHLKSTNTSVNPYTGMRVEFSIAAGEKGPIAKNIHDIETPPKKSFIIIGDTRIKVSNIKMYKIRTPYYSSDRQELWIETFQGDIFTFYSDDIDVIQKCHELDDLLCS